MRRFFYSYQSDDVAVYPMLYSLKVGDDVDLPMDICHHWCQVLRAKVGDVGVLFDGLGGEYQVCLSHIDKKSAQVTLQGFDKVDREANIHAKLALVMSRGDRMDYAIQKATELGVVAIQLLSSHHGEVHLKSQQVDKKLAHWQQIAISACEQCGLNRPPLLLAPMPIADYLSSSADVSNDKHNTNDKHSIKVSNSVARLIDEPYYQRLLMPSMPTSMLITPTDTDNDGMNFLKSEHIKLMLSVPNVDNAGVDIRAKGLLTVLNHIKSHVKNHVKPTIELLIGGEGGVSLAEQKQALATGWQAWQIGERVLRTETAPVVALASLQALYQSQCLNNECVL
ncbi:16S rRNA (uracil(1498)-N(3))-methyltransferase [Moraxella lincolnii]|uniref:Ribosomal RNA small subunit methyltransferase E n=1 Tax=Lwoffella lincolnii TaxID=90241 RepID=A0A1T0CHV2_9GAMM|nr:16S rRNA (uracil(1498)-N(3))-methyltransferase [Moraxella lincolnii]OOS21721.1 16S rRNA (uracil(1498)-N(3))-methyltransferase [Moraxella lincolnii]